MSLRTPSKLRKLQRALSAKAKGEPSYRFYALYDKVYREDILDFAYRKCAANGGVPGVDGESFEDIEEYGVERWLGELAEELRSKRYRPDAVKRVYIRRQDGTKSMPLGIPTIRDRVVQMAAKEVLEAIFEPDLEPEQYGYRRQRDPLDAVRHVHRLLNTGYTEVVDADLSGYFDAIDHETLLQFVEHRIADRRGLRLIQKWLSAGVMDHGKWTKSTEGTPQGATVSPLLAHLHCAFDLWAEQWRRRHGRGGMILVRFADDIVVGFQHRADATRFQRELRERLRKFSLELHPERTRRIEFGRFAADRRRERGLGKPETFDFLGFTHICARTRTGKFQLRRQTMRKRLRAKLREVKGELMRRRHLPIPDPGRWLGSLVRGYFAYHAVPTNIRALQAFRTQVEQHWLRALRRRGQRDRTTWERMRRLSGRWIPRPQILHPWPDTRFDAKTRGKSPVR